MQRILHITFIVFYATFSQGVNINLHYCLDKIKDIHIAFFSGNESCEAAEEDACCADKPLQESDEEKQHDCCSFETYVLNIDEQQENANFRLDYIAANTPVIQAEATAAPRVDTAYDLLFIPPAAPIFLRDCRLTYYG